MKIENIISGLLKLLGFIGTTLLGGFVMQYMFNAFVADTFSIGTISLFQAVGIDLLWSFLSANFSVEKEKRSYWELVALACMSDIIFLGISLVVAIFV